MGERKRMQVWLDDTEYEFIQDYAKVNHLMISELIRGWIHEVMRMENYEIKEPRNPELYKRR